MKRKRYPPQRTVLPYLRRTGFTVAAEHINHIEPAAKAPERLRSTGSSNRSSRPKALRDWLSRLGVGTLFIEPGSPRGGPASVPRCDVGCSNLCHNRLVGVTVRTPSSPGRHPIMPLR